MDESPIVEKQTVTTKEAPGPEGYPFVGVIPKIGPDPLYFFDDVAQRYGPVTRLEMGPETLYLVSHPDGVQHILQKNQKNYRKGYDEVKPLIGEGLVSSEGDFWLRQRRLIQPMFHRQRIEDFSAVMVGEADEMLTAWEQYAESGEPFDLGAEMTRMTQRIIARTMFSADVGEQTETLMEAFEVGLEYMNQMMFNPLPFIDRLPTPTNIRFWRALETLDEMMYGLIEERRALLAENPEAAPDDLLTMLLEAQDADTGERMTDKQIRDEVVTIFFAGHETTASALSWTWYILARMPDLAEKVRQEARLVLGGRRPGFEDVPRLTYTRQVLDESLRLFPPAWMFAREAIEDDEVCGYHIPAGKMVMLSPYVTHRDPDFWEQPYRFDPERFSEESKKTHHRYQYYPFGGGPRLCIGRDFSLVEATLIMAMMADRYRFRLVPGSPVEAQPVATLRPRPSVMMTIEPLS